MSEVDGKNLCEVKPYPEGLLKLVGTEVHHWRVLEPILRLDRGKNHNRYLRVKCICGKENTIRYDSILRGDSKSCGCRRGISCGVKYPVLRIADHILYQVWVDMNRRCYTENRKDYKHYGGRGISVCDEWVRTNKQGFINFLSDMEMSHEKGLELERLDRNGNYCLENCCWANRRSQVNNTSQNRNLKGYGVTLTMAEWGQLLEVNPSLFENRINQLNWEDNVENILSVVFRDRGHHLLYNGEDHNATAIFILEGYTRSQINKLCTKHSGMVKALESEGVEFTVIKGRSKDYLTFDGGLAKLRSKVKDDYESHLLYKIEVQLQGEKDE